MRQMQVSQQQSSVVAVKPICGKTKPSLTLPGLFVLTKGDKKDKSDQKLKQKGQLSVSSG